MKNHLEAKGQTLNIHRQYKCEAGVRNTENWGILYNKLFYGMTGMWADLSSFQLNRPPAMSETYKKHGHVPGSKVSATESMLRFWSLRRQNTNVPSNPSSPAWWVTCVLGGKQWGHLPTTGANRTAVNRAKPTHSSLQSCSVTGSLSQGQAHRKKSRTGLCRLGISWTAWKRGVTSQHSRGPCSGPPQSPRTELLIHTWETLSVSHVL